MLRRFINPDNPLRAASVRYFIIELVRYEENLPLGNFLFVDGFADKELHCFVTESQGSLVLLLAFYYEDACCFSKSVIGIQPCEAFYFIVLTAFNYHLFVVIV